MFAIAISYTDNRGNDKVKAFAVNAASKHEALGEVFMTMTKVVVGDFVVKGWDISNDEDTLLAVIEPHMRARKFIAGIKALRGQTGWDLKQSKAFCEAHRYDWPADIDPEVERNRVEF